MYYVKSKINDETAITIKLTDENVYTQCPDCGKEFSVDLYDVFCNDGDLYSTAIYCAECSVKRIKVKKIMPTGGNQ